MSASEPMQRSAYPIVCTARRSQGLTTGDRADDQQGLLSRQHGFRQRSVGRLVCQILLASKESQESTALLGRVIADRTLQHRIRGFDGVEHRALRNRALDLNFYFVSDMR